MSILLQNLSKRFGPAAVVNDISLEIQDGELFVLLGPSGSGKSTILKLIAGLVRADDGRILLHDRDVTHLPAARRNTGFVFQNYSLFRHMTVADNIEFGLTIRKVPKAARVARRAALLKLIGMAGLEGRYPRQLSGGQQQRVAVARALAFEPSVLLLDEPFGALDVKIRVQLRQVLKDIHRQLQVTTILVTHDQAEAFELGDRIGVIEGGRLLEVGVPAELYRTPQHRYVATFLGEANVLPGLRENGHVRVGPLRLAAPAIAGAAQGERPDVLFRPEDLTVAAQRDELQTPVLGQGVIEEIVGLGSLQRMQVRMETSSSGAPATDWGAQTASLQIARLAQRSDESRYRVGQTVWIGVRDFHLLTPATEPAGETD